MYETTGDRMGQDKFLSGLLGSIGGSIFSGLGNMFSGRSQRREAARNREAQMRLAQMDIDSRERLAESERRWMLEDRAYRAGAMGNYAQFNTRRIVRPDPVDTTVTPVRQTQTNPQQQQEAYGGGGGGLLNFRGYK